MIGAFPSFIENIHVFVDTRIQTHRVVYV